MSRLPFDTSPKHGRGSAAGPPIDDQSALPPASGKSARPSAEAARPPSVGSGGWLNAAMGEGAPGTPPWRRGGARRELTDMHLGHGGQGLGRRWVHRPASAMAECEHGA